MAANSLTVLSIQIFCSWWPANLHESQRLQLPFIPGRLNTGRAQMYFPIWECALHPKNHFLAEEIIYLGFEISHQRLALEQQKCTKIQEWASPETHDELSSLLGIFTY